MRVRAGLVTILVAAVVAGCGGSSATPTPSPAPSAPEASSPAAASEQPTESSAAETPAPTPKATPKPATGGYTVYVVKSGDTMYAIAKKFSTTVAAIMALNPTIKDPAVIHPGQKIKIPKK